MVPQCPLMCCVTCTYTHVTDMLSDCATGRQHTDTCLLHIASVPDLPSGRSVCVCMCLCMCVCTCVCACVLVCVHVYV